MRENNWQRPVSGTTHFLVKTFQRPAGFNNQRRVEIHKLRIITNSLRVAQILYKNTGLEVMVPDGTLLEFDVNEATIARTMMFHARHTLLVTDHTKFHASAVVSIGNVRKVNAFFTDGLLPAAFAQRLNEKNVERAIAEKDVA